MFEYLDDNMWTYVVVSQDCKHIHKIYFLFRTKWIYLAYRFFNIGDVTITVIVSLIHIIPKQSQHL